MAARIITFPAASAPRAPARLAAPRLAGFRATVAAMWDAYRTRRILAEMDSHQLADIGIGWGDAMTEAARPFWDVAARR